MTDPRSWTRWHTCVARQNGQRLVGHSCISPNADAGLHALRRGEKPRSPPLDIGHSSCLPIVLSSSGGHPMAIRWLAAVSHGRAAASPSWDARKHIDSGCRQHQGKSDDFWGRGWLAVFLVRSSSRAQFRGLGVLRSEHTAEMRPRSVGSRLLRFVTVDKDTSDNRVGGARVQYKGGKGASTRMDKYPPQIMLQRLGNSCQIWWYFSK